MAEFLTFRGAHWMDSIPPVEMDKWDAAMLAKYARRYREGDIVTVQEDDWRWSEAEEPKVVRIPDLKVADGWKYVVQDREIVARPEPQLTDFLSQKEIDDLSKTGLTPEDKLTECKSELSNITVLADGVPSPLPASGEVVVESRTALAHETPYVEFMGSYQAKAIPLSKAQTETVYARSRFRVDHDQVVDKVTGLPVKVESGH